MFACTKITLSVFLLSATKSFNQRQTTKAYLNEMMSISSHKQVEKVSHTEVLSLTKVLKFLTILNVACNSLSALSPNKGL